MLDRWQLSYPEDGTPQGGVISPLLANIYLHYVLDCWYRESVQPRMEGRTFLVRFADDFVLGFELKADAEKVYRVLFLRFEKYGLSLHADKTRLVPFGRPAQQTEPRPADGTKPGTFDFLGFTHYWGKGRKGQWVIRRKTSRKRFGRSLKRVRQWCWENMHEPLRVQVESLGRKLKGHFGYYGITGNAQALRRYRREVIRVWRKCLARRGGPEGMPWERMNRLLAFFYLPEARVGTLHLRSQTVTGGTVCGESARTGLWGCRRVTAGTTRKTALLRGGKVKGDTESWLRLTRGAA